MLYSLPLDGASDLLTRNNAAVVREPVFAEQGEQPAAHLGSSPAIYVDVGVQRIAGVNADAITIDRHFAGRMDD